MVLTGRMSGGGASACWHAPSSPRRTSTGHGAVFPGVLETAPTDMPMASSSARAAIPGLRSGLEATLGIPCPCPRMHAPPLGSRNHVERSDVDKDVDQQWPIESPSRTQEPECLQAGYASWPG